MKKLKLYTDKGEIFKYNLQIEGATYKNTTSRLCLEFEDGYNVYFKGKIDDKGNCSVNIPALKILQEGLGKAKIEVVADSTFFEIYEFPLELSRKVNVKFNESIEESKEEEIEMVDDKPKLKISFDEDFFVSEDEDSDFEDEISDPMPDIQDSLDDDELPTFKKWLKIK